MTLLENAVPESRTVAGEARTIALQMLRERGRGAVLVGVARVDAALLTLLQASMAPPTAAETLFHTDRPLGSFGARVALAARLGLIDAEIEKALHALRKIRNLFAHSTATAELEQPAVRHRLEPIYDTARPNPLWNPLERILSEHQHDVPDGATLSPALRDYILLITILVAFMESAALQLRPLRPPVVMGFGGITATPSNL